MKTVFIDCSPKKKGSASGFIASLTSTFVLGRKQKYKLRNKSDFEKILNSMKDADNVCFSMPLYIDCIPSHVLYFLTEMEDFCKVNNLKPNVYVIANNGFIEGKQNEPLMQIMENFCVRSNVNWCGGLGIGGGVMMNVMRILVPVYIGMLIFNILLTGIKTGNFIDKAPFLDFALEMGMVLFFMSGICFYDIKLSECINQKKKFGKHYTRIMVPSFIFILFADCFFVVVSLFKGGLFRGWFKKKKPQE